MGLSSYGQKKQVQRANQGCHGDIATDCDRSLGCARTNSEPIKPLGVDRPYRTGRNRARSLLGGILAQLIEEATDQLGDALECIAKQEKRVAKLQRKIENLKQLQDFKEEPNNN